MLEKAKGYDPSDNASFGTFIRKFNERMPTAQTAWRYVAKTLTCRRQEPVATKVLPGGPKARRNQPCPCGNGRKCKQCCDRD